MKTPNLHKDLSRFEETLKVPKTIVAACGVCGADIVLSEQQAVWDFLAHLAGFLAAYDYFCPICQAD